MKILPRGTSTVQLLYVYQQPGVLVVRPDQSATLCPMPCSTRRGPLILVRTEHCLRSASGCRFCCIFPAQYSAYTGSDVNHRSVWPSRGTHVLERCRFLHSRAVLDRSVAPTSYHGLTIRYGSLATRVHCCPRSTRRPG